LIGLSPPIFIPKEDAEYMPKYLAMEGCNPNGESNGLVILDHLKKTTNPLILIEF